MFPSAASFQMAIMEYSGHAENVLDAALADRDIGRIYSPGYEHEVDVFCSELKRRMEAFGGLLRYTKDAYPEWRIRFHPSIDVAYGLYIDALDVMVDIRRRIAREGPQMSISDRVQARNGLWDGYESHNSTAQAIPLELRCNSSREAADPIRLLLVKLGFKTQFVMCSSGVQLETSFGTFLNNRSAFQFHRVGDNIRRLLNVDDWRCWFYTAESYYTFLVARTTCKTWFYDITIFAIRELAKYHKVDTSASCRVLLRLVYDRMRRTAA